MIALLRYQAAILVRSNRWIFPLIAYGVLILTGTAAGRPAGPQWLSLADGLRAVRLKLWDEQGGRMVTFAQARACRA